MATGTALFETIDPATGEVIAEVPDALAGGRRRGSRPRERCISARAFVAVPTARGAGTGAVARRRPHRPARRRARRARDARPGPADRHRAPCERRGRGRALPLLRRLGHEDRRRDQPALLPGDVQLHAARARRRMRPDHSLELPADDRGLEARPRARVRQHLRRQARRADAAHRAAPRRAHRRGRRPRRRRQRRDRWPGGRRGALPSIPTSTRCRSPDRPRSGASIIRAAAGNFKRVSLELGGKNPAVVFDDAPLDGAVGGVLQGGLLNSGQVCAAYSRVYVQRSRRRRVRGSRCRGGVVDEARPWARSGDPTRPARVPRASRERRGLHPAGHRRRRPTAVRRRSSRRRPRGRSVPHAGGLHRRGRRHERSRATRSSGRSSASCRSTTTTRWWRAPTPPTTASALRSGRVT